MNSVVPPPPRSAPASIVALLDEHTASALALARRILLDERLAEDVVQEAFVAYWRDPAAYDGARGSFRSWFLALVHHKAVDAVRHEASQQRRADAVAERFREASSLDVAELVAGRMADARVRTALAELPTVQREALVLAYWGGYTQREIAQRTGAPLGTVKTRMMVGMRRLQNGLTAVVPGLAVRPGTPPVATAPRPAADPV
ncbi:sigma-70 family RNA polymerase sigma factor [Modestobacter sp. VKM Ac-2983]|uniref:sigma-70 family RNA polymerase sigma factor n=1 Tax=Modestobacter sp. VKM Ac-2983 TaxID=3004137 RepID=UPI0022AB5A45|nr:sigma-70 family RNA polymerase sigma factor [Modestobacter sp. VKM Ac-2983]MCZ2804799.1 sigma-70 family RNA polymerase sigma factor [Modestobacter sp. VKM Ac-2983]